MEKLCDARRLCVCVCLSSESQLRTALVSGGEGNALYPVLPSLWTVVSCGISGTIWEIQLIQTSCRNLSHFSIVVYCISSIMFAFFQREDLTRGLHVLTDTVRASVNCIIDCYSDCCVWACANWLFCQLIEIFLHDIYHLLFYIAISLWRRRLMSWYAGTHTAAGRSSRWLLRSNSCHIFSLHSDWLDFDWLRHLW